MDTMQTDRSKPFRAFKKRACIACLSCRGRKVRCDVSKYGSPCTNCTTDEVDCIIKRRNKRHHYSRSESEASSTETAKNSLVIIPTCDAIQEVPPYNTAAEVLPNLLEQSSAESPDTDDVDSSHVKTPCADVYSGLITDKLEFCQSWNTPVKARNPESSLDFKILDPSDEALNGPLNMMVREPGLAGRSLENSAITKTHVSFSYYRFIDSDGVVNLSAEDFNFLDRKHCFRMPTRSLLNELVKHYFLFVHPHLPIINEGAFWEVYTARSIYPAQRSRVSLFVVQAMMFVSCSFLSQETIQSLGFANHRSARAAYYQRAKFLFDFDTKRDSISTAQGTLLLSYHTPMGNVKMNSYWLGIAIHFARDAKAHLYFTSSHFTREEKNIRKRLWWCCILRDRIISLGVRRPLQISLGEFDTSQAPPVEEDFEEEVRTSKVYSVTLKRSLIQLLIMHFELGAILTNVLMVTYSIDQIQGVGFSLSTEADFQRVELCRSALDHWFEKSTMGVPPPADEGDISKSLVLFKNLMFMYYHSAKVSLYHHATLLTMTKSVNDGCYWRQKVQVRRRLEEAIRDITENVEELLDFKLVKYLPISIVAYITLPLILHILDAKLSSTASQRARKRKRFDIFRDAMQQLRLQYDSTDGACDMIERVIQTMDVFNVAQPIHLAGNIKKRISQRHKHKSETPISLSNSGDCSNIRDWGDVLHYQPNSYLRLAMTVDFTLSQGKLPEDTDLPTPLQFSNRGGASVTSDTAILNQDYNFLELGMEDIEYDDHNEDSCSSSSVNSYDVDPPYIMVPNAVPQDHQIPLLSDKEQPPVPSCNPLSPSLELQDELGLLVDLADYETAMFNYKIPGSPRDWAEEIFFGNTGCV